MFRYVIIFISLIFSQGLDYNANFYDRVSDEINSISNKEISSSLFIYPQIQKESDSFYNFVKGISTIFKTF